MTTCTYQDWRRRAGSRARTAVLAALGVAVLTVLSSGRAARADEPEAAALPDSIVLAEFAMDSSGFPPDWQPRKDTHREVTPQRYWLASDSTGPFLRAEHRPGRREGGTQIVKGIEWDVHRYPILRWQWRALELPDGGDERHRSRNDCVASLYVVYGMRNYLVTRVPITIKYTWSTETPIGSEIEGRFGTNWVRVLESGPSERGRG